MKSRQICGRCGKTLRPGLGPDGPMHLEMTGETICGDCMMSMLETISPPVEDNFEVKEFLRKAVGELCDLTGVAAERFSIHCKQFTSHDVEIRIENDVYHIVLIYDLIEDPTRWRQSREYVVSWIRNHPPSTRSWAAQTSTNTKLATHGRFVFVFLPEELPKPPNNFGREVARELCRSMDDRELGWMVCPISTVSEEHGNQDIANAIQAWASTQNQPDSLRFDVKKVRFRFSPDECTCVIVRR